MNEQPWADLRRLAALLRNRNEIDVEITRIIGRPAQSGHLGEYVASRIFRIRLAASAVQKGHDGVFEDGPLQGRTVNIKFYGKQEGILDVDLSGEAQWYLVLTGPKGTTVSSKGTSRPWVLAQAFLFEAASLNDALNQGEVQLGTATSVRKALWDAAEIYPHQRNRALLLSDEQRNLLALFSSSF